MCRVGSDLPGSSAWNMGRWRAALTSCGGGSCNEPQEGGCKRQRFIPLQPGARSPRSRPHSLWMFKGRVLPASSSFRPELPPQSLAHSCILLNSASSSHGRLSVCVLFSYKDASRQLQDSPDPGTPSYPCFQIQSYSESQGDADDLVAACWSRDVTA